MLNVHNIIKFGISGIIDYLITRSTNGQSIESILMQDLSYITSYFFFMIAATTEINTLAFVGIVRCVYEPGHRTTRLHSLRMGLAGRG